MDDAISHTLVDDIIAKGSVSADDVLALRQTMFKDGLIDRHEAEQVFRIDAACTDKDPDWAAFFVDALTDHVVWKVEPKKYVTDEKADFLISNILRDGRVDSETELELLINVVHWSVSCPPPLALLAMRAIRDSVMEPETAAYGSNRPPAVISPSDVALIRKVLYAPGSPGGYTVTREEAELIVALNNATKDTERPESWDLLYRQTIANFLMFPGAAPSVPSAEEELRRDRWMNERRGVGGFLKDAGSSFRRLDIPVSEAWREFDPFGSVAAREEQEKETERLRRHVTGEHHRRGGPMADGECRRLRTAGRKREGPIGLYPRERSPDRPGVETFAGPGGPLRGSTTSSRSHARIDRLIDRAAGLHPILEPTEVPHIGVAEILQGLAGQRRAPTRRAIQDHRPIFGKCLKMKGRLRVGAKLQHAAADMNGTGHLTAGLHLRRVAHIHHQGLPGINQRSCLLVSDLPDRRICDRQHIFHRCRHESLPQCRRSALSDRCKIPGRIGPQRSRKKPDCSAERPA